MAGFFLTGQIGFFEMIVKTQLTNLFRNKDASLAETAIQTFIEKPLEFGWDKIHDGIFYFLDADGDIKVFCK